MTLSKTTPDRQTAPRRGWKVVFTLLLGALLLGRLGLGQAQVPPTPPIPPGGQPGAQPGAPGVVQAATETPIPLNEDPNDPNIKDDERLRRQKSIIMKRIELRQRTLEEAQRKADEAAQAAQQAQQTQTPVLGQKAAAPTPVPGAPGATPGDTPAVAGGKGKDIKQLPTVTMFLAPAEVIVRTGERFSTECDMLNVDHLPVDSFELVLSYPAYSLKLLGIHQDKIKPMIAGEPECRIDQKHGTVIYKVRLVKPVNAVDLKTVTLVWQALAPVDMTDIRLVSGERVSRVLGGGKILSESLTGRTGAVLGTLVRIDPKPGSAPQGYRYLDLDNSQLMLAGFKDQRKLRPPKLWIHQPEDKLLKPGEWQVVDLGVDNPDEVVFDEVRLAASFDPEAVEIVDSDRGNWISEGINLLDGPFHEDWPWDQHYMNTVDMKRGLFYYRMGMNDLREQPSGTLARVFVRVKRPIQGPIFTWIWNNGSDPVQPSTGVYLFNQNLYKKLLKGAKGATPAQLAGKMPAFDLPLGVEKADPSLYRNKETE